MQARIRFTHATMETVGSHSLSGMVVNKVGPANVASISEVVLEFEQSSLETTRKNNGPKEVIMPEFAVPCLIENVLSLQKRGVAVKVEFVIEGAPIPAFVHPDSVKKT